jgi:hypothetical protein
MTFPRSLSANTPTHLGRHRYCPLWSLFRALQGAPLRRAAIEAAEDRFCRIIVADRPAPVLSEPIAFLA